MSNNDEIANIRSAIFINQSGNAVVFNYPKLNTRNEVMTGSFASDAGLVIASNTSGASRILKARYGVFIGGKAKDDVLAPITIVHPDGIVMNPDSDDLDQPKKDDASNLPPISNKVEGGGHFGLG